MEERTFSLDEANRMLPLLRPILQSLQKEWNAMQQVNDEIQKAHEAADGGGGSLFGSSYVQSAEKFIHHFHRVQELGVLLKDPGTGLCDFAHRRGEKIVYLCWRLDEEKIGWWHDVDAGFAGREPLEDLDD